MIPSADYASAIERLAARLPGRILFDRAAREQFQTDFGRWRYQVPGAVARCRSSEEVATVVRFCRENRLPIAARSQGHTQSGQSLTPGVLIDTSAMNGVLSIQPAGADGFGWADCQAGVVWRDLVVVSTAQGLIPPVLTNNLGVTISGTTSMAGLGVASFRHGSQADNALEIECVTGDGEIHVCSREIEPELFDMVRCGLGQIAIITRVRTRLRRCAAMVRMYTLVYDDLGRWMADAEKVLDPSDGTFSTAGGICTPSPLGFKKIGDGLELGKGMIGFGLWLYPMFLTIEFEPGREPDDEQALAKLSPWRRSLTQDLSIVEFSRRMEPMFEAWKLSGYWENPHPWMETTLPWETAKEYIERALNLPGRSSRQPRAALASAPASRSFLRASDGERVLGGNRRGAGKLDGYSCRSTWRSSRLRRQAPVRLRHLRHPERWKAHFSDAVWAASARQEAWDRTRSGRLHQYSRPRWLITPHRRRGPGRRRLRERLAARACARWGWWSSTPSRPLSAGH
jgi:FAD/FMN-containing dehydrogenase